MVRRRPTRSAAAAASVTKRPVSGGTTASRPWIATRMVMNIEISATAAMASAPSAKVKKRLKAGPPVSSLSHRRLTKRTASLWTQQQEYDEGGRNNSHNYEEINTAGRRNGVFRAGFVKLFGLAFPAS